MVMVFLAMDDEKMLHASGYVCLVILLDGNCVSNIRVHNLGMVNMYFHVKMNGMVCSKITYQKTERVAQESE